MASCYTRPELTKADLRTFRVAKSVMLNPNGADVIKALKMAEKGCKYNRLSQQAALATYDQFATGKLPTIFAGDYKCERRMQYPTQGTVLQLIRISDEQFGLICDRQVIEPGRRSRSPVVLGPKGLFSGQNPIAGLNSLLVYFWPYLSDADLDEIHQAITEFVLTTTITAAERPRRTAVRAQREFVIESLCRGVKPAYTTQFAQTCVKIANDVEMQGHHSILWPEIKRHYPGPASKYKTHLLAMIEKNRLSTETLLAAKRQLDFDIRPTAWKGKMRLFDVPQLVLQVRNIPIHHRFKAGAVWHNELSVFIKTKAKDSLHAATENTLGWFRIHIDDENQICFVDEVQSDAMELALSQAKDPRYGAAARDFMQECGKWHLDAFATVCQWAQEIGYRAAIHSRDTAAEKDYMTESERKWITYYRAIAKQFGLKKIAVPNYPGAIWVDEADNAEDMQHSSRD